MNHRKLICLLFCGRIILLIALVINSSSSFSQRREEGRSYKNEDKKTDADKMCSRAWKLWKNDKYLEAENLYYKANELFPLPNGLPVLAAEKMKLGDVKGANKTWDIYRQSLIAMPTGLMKASEIANLFEQHYSQRASLNFESGDSRIAVEATINYMELFRGKKPGGSANTLFDNACKVAFFLEDRKSLQTINELAKTMEKNMFNVARRCEFFSGVFLLILDKKYKEAEAWVLDVMKNKGGFNGSGDWAEFTLPYVYLAQEDYEKFENSVQIAKEGRPKLLIGEGFFERTFRNFYGIIDLHKRKYQEAIIKFTGYIERRAFGRRVNQVDQFRYYCYRAEAHEGLGEIDKAKKDYEAALLYSPGFEPAIQGLARLEGKIIAERKTDKTPPQVIITEPESARGVIVEATGNDLMIKGTATDPGGIRSVTINGEKVFSQENGNFWGNVTLKEGINKFIVVATDFSGNAGEKTVEIKQGSSVSVSKPAIEKEGKNYALLIGCQNYDDGNIPSLEDPIPDAVRLKLTLKNNYNFDEDNIFTLFNPEQSDLKKQFLEILEMIQPEDNLVIFYAGHGIWVEKEKKGYWLLTDAKLNDVNTWVPNKTVLDLIGRIPSRHTLLITDACFSGSVFRTRGLNTDMPAPIQQLNAKISRVAITSGNDTEVPDKSVFMKYLIKALAENKDKYLTAQKMFISQILEAVMTETKTEPRYGTLEASGHIGGDFIFTRK